MLQSQTKMIEKNRMITTISFNKRLNVKKCNRLQQCCIFILEKSVTLLQSVAVFHVTDFIVILMEEGIANIFAIAKLSTINKASVHMRLPKKNLVAIFYSKYKTTFQIFMK